MLTSTGKISSIVEQTCCSSHAEAPVGNACQETAQLQSPRPMETESETIDHSRPTQIIEPFLLSAGTFVPYNHPYTVHVCDI